MKIEIRTKLSPEEVRDVIRSRTSVETSYFKLIGMGQAKAQGLHSIIRGNKVWICNRTYSIFFSKYVYRHFFGEINRTAGITTISGRLRFSLFWGIILVYSIVIIISALVFWLTRGSVDLKLMPIVCVTISTLSFLVRNLNSYLFNRKVEKELIKDIVEMFDQ